MKSYAESVGSEVIDWETVLKQENPDWFKLQLLATDWRTCIIGQLSDKLLRSTSKTSMSINGRPVDKELRIIGKEFSKAIWKKDVKRALDICQIAKRRTSELLTI